jgi:hypothetical protein
MPSLKSFTSAFCFCLLMTFCAASAKADTTYTYTGAQYAEGAIACPPECNFHRVVYAPNAPSAECECDNQHVRPQQWAVDFHKSFQRAFRGQHRCDWSNQRLGH